MKRHDTDVVSLVFGLLFLGISLGWLLMHENVLQWSDLTVAGPLLLVGAGLAGVFASLSRARRRNREDAELDPFAP